MRPRAEVDILVEIIDPPDKSVVPSDGDIGGRLHGSWKKTREMGENTVPSAAGSHLAVTSGAGSTRTSTGLELTTMDLHRLIERVRSEFLEMPGLRLTPAQAARLWNVDAATCHRIISTLVGTAFLRWTQRGTVMRAEH